MEPVSTSPGDADEETTAAFQKALADFKQRCSERSFKTFEHKSVLQVKYEIVRIQQDQERLRNMMGFRRIQSFIEKMEEFSKVLKDIVDIELFVSYIWGAMQFLLQQASSTMLEGFDGLLDAYARLGEKMPNLKNLQALFTRYTGMRKCLGFLYADILQFHAGVYQCFTQFSDRGRKKIFRSAWTDFSYQVDALEDRIAAHAELVDHGSRMLDFRMREENATHLSASENHNLSSEVRNHATACIDRDRRAKDSESKRHSDQVESILGWLSAGPDGPNASEEIHNERCEVRESYPDTCKWITENETVDNWMNTDTPTNSILWINGSMGAGKSTLASYLIDECKKNTSLAVPFKTVYFYCKAKEPAVSTYLGIFRGLLYQQLSHIRNNEKFRHVIAYCHDKKEQSGQQQQQLNTEDKAKSLLDLFFDVIPNQYIVIDGLDECEKPEIKQCLALLTSAVSRQDNIDPGRLRLLVVSRDIPEIKRPLTADGTTANIIKIQPENNEAAISTYVGQRIKEFPSAFKLTKDERERIRDLTCSKAKGAQGMFLFAKLVMDNLKESYNKERLLQELDKRLFPQNLNQAYDRIIDRIRKNQDNERWEKAKSIFGWLICAGRILRWHEIQAIVSIERHEQSVEFEHRKFVTDLYDLCGSLVHVKPGSKVELIHHTAHEFILKSQFVSKVEVQFELATLCMQYLTFPCFERAMDKRSAKSFAKNGFYAFQDYAVSRWFYHISEVVKISGQLLSVDEAKAKRFAGILDDFTARYQDSIDDHTFSSEEPLSSSSSSSMRSTVNIKEVEENARNECDGLKETVFYEMLVNLWIHIAKYEKENIDERNKPSLAEMEKTLMDNRKVIEELVVEAKDDAARKELEEYYGRNVYKCPRTRCDFFYEGFEHERKRDHHIARHDRPFECPVAGCHMGDAGFISNKDLERHRKNYHATGAGSDEPAPFPQPNKKKNHDARFPCEICGQRFTRKINLTGHTRSHFGERPYGCQTCGKKFTRVNDLRRHERLHLRK